MNLFRSEQDVVPTLRFAEHGGIGRIDFKRVFSKSDFAARIDFVDYTRIPPGSTIGLHEHHGNEEIYFVVAGTPLIRLNSEQRRLCKGSFAVVRDGECHELINDCEDETEILVIQVSSESGS